MKTLSVTILLVFIAFSIKAQEPQNDKPKTEFIGGNGNVPVTGFGGPIFQLAFINGSAASFFGGGGAALFNNNFYFGGFGMGMNNEVQIENKNPLTNNFTPVGKLEIGFGGLMIGYMPNGYKKLHPLFGLDFGWGGYNVYNLNEDSEFLEGSLSSITPRAGIEANALPWLKLNAGVGYRIVAGQTNTFFDISDLNSPLFELRLHFGWFGQ